MRILAYILMSDRKLSVEFEILGRKIFFRFYRMARENACDG